MEGKGLLARLQEISERRDAEVADDDYDPGDHEAFPPPPPLADRVPAEPKVAEVAHRPAKNPPAGDRVHTSVYLPRDVWRRLREIAAAEDCKVHDLVIEGVIEAVTKRARR